MIKQQQLEWQNRLRRYIEECSTPYAAIEAVLLKATEHAPLTLKDLRKWQQLLSSKTNKMPAA